VLHRTLAGRFDDALDDARRLFERDRARNLSAEGTYATQRLAIQWIRREYEESLDLLEYEMTRERVYLVTSYSICRLHALLGRTAEARREWEEAAQGSFRHVPRDHTLLASVMILTDICAVFGDAARARELYDLSLPFESMLVAPFVATACFGAAARALGILAHVFRDYAGSERHFQHAIAIERELSAPLLGETLLRYGQMLLERGEPGDADRAFSVLTKARNIAEEFGMKRHHATLSELLAARCTGVSGTPSV
jgi:tetratricopeptide (TPR) repeat protein